MQGDTVLVRAYRGVPRVLRVWETSERLIYVCSAEAYERLKEGVVAPEPIGVPREDVFEVDDALVERLRSDPEAWADARIYTSEETGDRWMQEATQRLIRAACAVARNGLIDHDDYIVSAEAGQELCVAYGAYESLCEQRDREEQRGEDEGDEGRNLDG